MRLLIRIIKIFVWELLEGGWGGNLIKFQKSLKKGKIFI
jgi:hypothetical protein